MADFNTSKVDGNTVTSAEWNQFADIDNIITTSGQTPASGDLNQLGIAAARYSSGGQFYTDSGTANAYVLTPVSPFKAPVDATNGYFNGMIVVFRAGNANTGASTVNVNGAGVKNLQKEDGSALAAGDIQLYSDAAFRYNGTAFVRFRGNATITSRGQTFLANPITIANNATTPNTDIDFTAGVFQFSDGTGQAVLTAMTKRLQSSGSWSAGAAGNMLLTGAKANSSTYHLFAIHNPTTGVSDYGALLGVAGTAPDPTASLPSGYTKFRRVGSILTDGSGNIRPFTQRFRTFEFTTPVLELDASGSNGSTLQNTSLPAGIVVNGHFTIGLDLATGSSVGNYYASVQNADQNFTPSGSGVRGYTVNVFKSSSATGVASVPCYAFSNTSRQIRLVQAGAGTLCSITFITHGWDDILL